jgi:hypothetical protein
LPVKVRVSTVEGVTFDSGDPAAIGAPGRSAAQGPRMRVVGGVYRFEGLKGIAAIELRDLNGGLVRRLSAYAESMVWDGTDSGGRPAPPGVLSCIFLDRSGRKASALAVRLPQL